MTSFVSLILLSSFNIQLKLINVFTLTFDYTSQSSEAITDVITGVFFIWRQRFQPCGSHMLLAAIFGATIALSSACVKFQRLRLSEAVVSAVRPLCRVTQVPGASSCAQLCLREANCGAARHHAAIKQCDLLTTHFDSLEGPAAFANASGPVEVWAVVGRGFGECPVSYAAPWHASRYRLSTEKTFWSGAERKCRLEGGKLAELTSREERIHAAHQ